MPDFRLRNCGAKTLVFALSLGVPRLSLEMKLNEGVAVSMGSTRNRMMSLYSAARYGRLPHLNMPRHLIATSAFRGWLVRLAMDESLAVLHETTTPAIGESTSLL